MPICPTCLTKYAEGLETCTVDGAALAPDEAYAHTDKELQAGDQVGEYRIEAKIGEGGFGAVYRAVHPVIGKLAAVKVLGRQFSSNPQMVSRFISEARAVNQIGHRNIIDVFSFGQLPDGRQYYVMELLSGTTFDKYLREQKRLTLEQAMPILKGIARAMDAAHAKGILHRDLKPENVFLVFDEDGHVQAKLLDFGLVKLLGEASGSHKTKTGTPMGTPYYMSPEQCRGVEVDAHTDVYAFGAMVFQVLTGRVPFEGESAMDILVKHMSQDPPSASSLVPELSAEVDLALRRMLAKEPKFRPDTLGQALEELASQSGLSAGMSTPRLPPPSGAIVSGPDVTASATSATVADVRADKPNAEPRPAQTLLGSESDVTPPRASRTPLVVGVGGALVLALVAAVALVSLRGPRAETSQAGLTSQPSSPDAAAPLAPSGAPSGAPSVAPSVASKEDPREVSVTISGAPPGAKIALGDKDLGPGPGPFKVRAGAPVKLTISAKGYKPREVSITPTEDVTLPGALDRQAGTPGTPRGPSLPSDLESFDGKK
jgi:eukaryotic-like serine/threonine-protein kinase